MFQSHALIKRGSQHLVNAKTDEALLDFQQASTFTPNSTDVYHHRGQMHSLMDHMNEAVTDYQQSVKLAPDWPAAAVRPTSAVSTGVSRPSGRCHSPLTV